MRCHLPHITQKSIDNYANSENSTSPSKWNPTGVVDSQSGGDNIPAKLPYKPISCNININSIVRGCCERHAFSKSFDSSVFRHPSDSTCRGSRMELRVGLLRRKWGLRHVLTRMRPDKTHSMADGPVYIKWIFFDILRSKFRF